MGASTYAWAGLPDGPALRFAALKLRLPGAAVFAGRSAAWLHGLDVPGGVGPIEVLVPAASGVSGRVGVLIRRVELKAGDVVVRQGLRTTSMPRTLADLSRALSTVETVVAFDTALHGRLTTLARLAAWLRAHSGAKGTVRFGRLLDLAEPGSQSPMETRLRLLFVLDGLPRPEVQVSLHDDAGRFLGRVDLYYPQARLGIEYDGGHHRESLVADNRRQNQILEAGYHLLRFTKPDIYETPLVTIAKVRAALAPHRDTRIRGHMHPTDAA